MIVWTVVDWAMLVLLGVCVVFWPTQVIGDSVYRWLRIFAVALCALQLIADGPRMQLYGAYAVSALFAVLLIARRGDTEPSAIRESREGVAKKAVRWTLVAGTGAAVAASMLLCVLYPRTA